jgi:hypothetical protein
MAGYVNLATCLEADIAMHQSRNDDGRPVQARTMARASIWRPDLASPDEANADEVMPPVLGVSRQAP